jgi:lipopolysaccharide export system protein LptC
VVETTGSTSDSPTPEVGVSKHRRRIYIPQRRRPAAGASRLVAFMKLVLPAAALAMVGLTLAWPQLLPDQSKFRISESTLAGVDIDGLVMDNPRYVGIDKKRRPYQLSAATASQNSKNDHLVYLSLPKADIVVSETGWVAVTARSGVYDKTAETVALSGGVTIFYDRGYEFQSETAEVNLREGTAQSDQPVTGHGEAGEIVAEGFRLYDRGARVVFTGRSRAVLQSARKDPS